MSKLKNFAGSELFYGLIALIYAAASIYIYNGVYRPICLLLCVAAALAVALKSGSALSRRFTAQSASVGIYVIIVALSLIWAASGKLFQNEFSKLLIAFAVYLLILIRGDGSVGFVRRVVTALCACCTAYAFFSVDMATLKLSAPLFGLFTPLPLSDVGFEPGTRLTGIFGNGNILAGVLAMGIFLSLYLADSADSRARRAFASISLSACAYTFVMAFSMGATGFFAVCTILYLIAAGEGRARALVRMVNTAIPTLVFVFLSFGYYEADGAALAVPLICFAANCLCGAALELIAAARLSAFLEKRRRIFGGVIIAVVLLAGMYAAAALTVTGGYDFAPGGSLRRSAYPAAGTYALAADCTDGIDVYVESQNDSETVMHTSTQLYSGPLNGCEFTVPEDSRVVYFNFHAPAGGRLNSVSLSDGTALKLDYKLLPDFIANRMQGLWANENAIQRTTFFSDGIKIFRRSPILGSGMGSFESLICGYQNFYYTTKYVHNHYIQVLLDNGIIGLSAYLFILISALAAIIKNGRKDSRHRAFVPAAAACLAMICLHGIMEVIMSAAAFLPIAFAVWALISVCWGTPLAGKSKEKKSILPTVFRWACAAVVCIYAVLFALNMYAFRKVSRSMNNPVSFYSAIETAINIDAFEGADYKLSYVMNSINAGARYRGKASRYAAELTERPSNSTHVHLISYYLGTEQYDKAVYAAQRGIDFNFSNPEVWNSSISAFDGFTDEGTVKAGLVHLSEMLDEYNAVLMEPIVLDELPRRILHSVS